MSAPMPASSVPSQERRHGIRQIIAAATGMVDAIALPAPRIFHSPSSATRTTPRRNAPGNARTWASRACGRSMICAAPTKRCCSMTACRCMWSQRGADTIRRCCCAATPSARGRRTQARLRSSAPCRRECLEGKGGRLGPTWVQRSRCCRSVLTQANANYLTLLMWKGGRVV
jgi:hypothetical protein